MMSNFCNAARRAAIAVALGLGPLLVFAGPFGDLQSRQGRMSDTQVMEALRSLGKGDPESEGYAAQGAQAARSYVALRATLEGDRPTKPPKIGPSPGQERLASSWLARAFQNLKRPEVDLPKPQVPSAIVGGWVTPLMWGLIAALIGLAIFLLARYVRFPGLRSKRQMIAEEEPLRSADAWLEESNALIAQGRYREAVRGLYVAGLMRLDEAGVARFDRHQTNWEHLRRIEASAKAPREIDVREATGRFDRFWYGHLPATLDDAHSMRSWYDRLVRRLTEAKA